MLTCPRCAATLKALRYGPKAVWGCPTCGGCAAALALLRDSVAHERWKPLQRAVATAELPSTRPCPSCRNPMLQADAPHVTLETCRRCQLLWFDRGEAPEPRPREKPLSPEAAEALVRFQGRDGEDDELAALWQLAHLNQGLPVEIGQESLSNVPFATGALTLVVIVVGLVADAPSWIARYGFLPGEPFRDAGITLFTYFFLHSGAWHLAGNAYFLVVFGDNVEEAAGRAGFVVLALLGAAAGALMHALLDPLRIFPLVGANAGISALLAYYGLRFPKARIGWYYMNLPAWGFALLWAGYQVLLAVPLSFGGVTEVSGAAHLGGAAVGVAFFAVQRRMSPWTSKERPPS
jgi:membrane associated rhomboid family serine protease